MFVYLIYFTVLYLLQYREKSYYFYRYYYYYYYHHHHHHHHHHCHLRKERQINA